MNREKAIENFKNWNPRVLLVGIVDFKNGSYGLQSTLCSTKEEVYTAMKNYENFDLYYVKKSVEGEMFYRNEFSKFVSNLQSLKNDSQTNDKPA